MFTHIMTKRGIIYKNVFVDYDSNRHDVIMTSPIDCTIEKEVYDFTDSRYTKVNLVSNFKAQETIKDMLNYALGLVRFLKYYL